MERLFRDIETQYGKEAGKTCRDVTAVVRAKIIAKDLFGWRSFIDDVLIDLVLYMINDNFAHSGGGYVACGMQSAIDHCRYCNAAKRRGNYELVSLDEFYQVADDIEDSSTKEQADTLLFDISIRWGTDLASKLEPLVRGYQDKLSNDVLKIIRSPEFVEWFKCYTGRE
nr:MAG TPA: hypothetical protein [Caudoviricetes sp.]